MFNRSSAGSTVDITVLPSYYFFLTHVCLQIVSFLVLHFLNLCTTLTPAASPTRYNTQTSVQSVNALGDLAPGTRKVDITIPSIANVLSSLAQTESSSHTDLIVKVSPPIYVRIIPSFITTTESNIPPVASGEMIEKFMSNWTRLVGDPVLSKWIVLVLAVSVALNGYLLKGIAAGGGTLRPQGVRFRSFGGGNRLKKEAEEREEPKAPREPTRPAPSVAQSLLNPVPESAKQAKPRDAPVLAAPIAIPASRPPAFILDTIDQKLREAAKESPISSESLPVVKITSNEPTRTLEECIDIFENGPRPVSVSLSMLSDEEVIMLAQNGKIAAYALEKVLGDLERAVLIRRALICKY